MLYLASMNTNYGSPGPDLILVGVILGGVLVLRALIGRDGRSRQAGLGVVTALALFLGVAVVLALSGQSFDPVGYIGHHHHF